MITIEALELTITGLRRQDVEVLIAQEVVRPAGQPGAWLFRDIDVARLRLIHELRRDLALHEEALPVVLHLLDQLYDTRRRLLRLRAALEHAAPPEVQQAVADRLADGGP